MRTVAGADQVVVLSGGIVAEQGSPAELYARKGLYTHMVDLQSASRTGRSENDGGFYLGKSLDFPIKTWYIHYTKH